MESIDNILTKALQQIADKYGVIISNLHANWIDTSTMQGTTHIIQKISADIRIIEPLSADEPPAPINETEAIDHD